MDRPFPSSHVGSPSCEDDKQIWHLLQVRRSVRYGSATLKEIRTTSAIWQCTCSSSICFDLHVSPSQENLGSGEPHLIAVGDSTMSSASSKNRTGCVGPLLSAGFVEFLRTSTVSSLCFLWGLRATGWETLGAGVVIDSGTESWERTDAWICCGFGALIWWMLSSRLCVRREGWEWVLQPFEGYGWIEKDPDVNPDVRERCFISGMSPYRFSEVSCI